MRNIDNPHFRCEVAVTCKDEIVPLVYFDCILMENYVTVVIAKLSKPKKKRTGCECRSPRVAIVPVDVLSMWRRKAVVGVVG